MKKLTNLLAAAVVAVAILFGSNAKAQTTPPSQWRLGFGVEGGIPTGSVNDGHKFDLGGSARLQYGLAKNFALTLTSGYTSFMANQAEKDAGGSAFGVIPVKVGLKAFYTDNLYVGAEAGAGFETGIIDSQTKLLLSTALGWANEHWDVGVNYTNYSGSSFNYGAVNLRLAYGFGL
jgi:hypothetical protein